MATKKEYTGTVYVGVVGGDTESGECRDSIEKIYLRPGDEGPIFYRATKGYEARQLHLNNWIEKTVHPFMLLLDHDMVFPVDVLERLRAHKLPFVSGYYLRRRYAPLAPVWFKLPPKYAWPMEPWLDEPERGKLHPLGASGWGCMLLHRDVVMATKPLLKGEQEILEDDLDVWPYDLPAVLEAMRGLRWLADTEAESPATLQKAVTPFVEILEREIRPLRGRKDIVGSDIRYPFYAREAGHILMGDPDCRCKHMLDYPLSPDDFSDMPPDARENIYKEMHQKIGVLRRDQREVLERLGT